MNQNNFNRQYKKSVDKMPEVKTILKNNSKIFLNIRDATPEEDMREATDLKILIVEGGEIAVRIRENKYKKYKDFTIRAKTQYNNKTEIDKIREDFGKWFFYGWLSLDDIIDEWILVDLDVFRSSGLAFNIKELKMNPDGTGFYYYSIDELFKNECICGMGKENVR